MVAPHDVAGAVAEARRCVEELGFKAVFLAPGCVNRRPWHHPAYDPLWAEIQRLDVPIAFHGGGQTYLRPDFSLEVLDRLMLWHTFNQPLAIQFVTVCLCGGGVLERFPDLRVALLEGNCSWAPWLLHRLDEHYEWTGWYEAPDLTMKPSEYFRRNCFLSVEADEATALATTSTGSAPTTSCSRPTTPTATRSTRTPSTPSRSSTSPSTPRSGSSARTGRASTGSRSKRSGASLPSRSALGRAAASRSAMTAPTPSGVPAVRGLRATVPALGDGEAIAPHVEHPPVTCPDSGLASQVATAATHRARAPPWSPRGCSPRRPSPGDEPGDGRRRQAVGGHAVAGELERADHRHAAMPALAAP